MKNFIKYIFTAIIFMLSLVSVSAADVADIKPVSGHIIKQVSETILLPQDCESFIVTTNNHSQEIFTNNTNKNSNFSGSLDKISSLYKSINEFFKSEYSNIITLKSHKLSSFLTYEICTRAP